MDIAGVLVERRSLLAVLTMVVSIAVGWGVTKTSIDPRSDAILPEDDPYAAQVEEVEADGSLVVRLASPVSGGARTWRAFC